jgi:hypothetical protein
MTVENWKRVNEPGAARYRVSNLGRIKRGKQLITPYTWSGSGESFIRVKDPDLGDKCYYVHRLVAKAFVKNNLPRHARDRALVIRKNGDRSDNRAENLEWVTRSQMCRSYTKKFGDNVWKKSGRKCSILKPDDIREIRRQHASGRLLKLIAYDFSISEASVSRIAHRRVWKDVE